MAQQSLPYNIYFFGQPYDHLPDNAIIRMRIGMTKDGDGSRPTDGKAYIPDGIAHAVIPSPTSDGVVHDFLKENHRGKFKSFGGKGHEVIELTVAEWKFLDSRIREFITGKPYIKAYEHTPRREQLDFIAKAASFYSDLLNHKLPFLCNAVPRFGKTFTALHLIKQCQFKNILVLTRRPADTKRAWKTEADNPNVNFIDTSEQNQPVQLDPTKLFNVVFASYQDATDLSKAKFTNILTTHFDFVICDECHYGSETELAKTIRSSFNYDHLLYLSGTPFKQLASGDFTDANTFNFSYIDEQKLRDEEITNGLGTSGAHYQCCPLRIKSIKLPPNLYTQTAQFTDEEGFSFTKFLRTENGKFVNATTVNDFLSFLRLGDMPYTSQPQASGQYLQPDFKDHTVWYLPGVDACDAMKDMLEQHPYFQNYNIITAYDDNRGQGKNTLENVIEQIGNAKRDGKPGTITLSVDKLSHGASVPEWGSIFMMYDGASPEKYTQQAFRSKTPRNGKEEAYVFDFNPHRTLGIIYSMAEALGNPDIEVAIKEYLRVLNPFILCETSWEPIKTEDVINHFAFSSNRSRDLSLMFRNMDFNIADLDDDTLALIKGLSKPGGIDDLDIGDHNDGDKGKNMRVVKSAINGDKTEKDETEIIKEKMKIVFEQIPNYLSVVRGNTIDDVLNNSTEKKCKEFLGISLKQLKTLLSKDKLGEVERHALNAKIKAMRLVEKEESSQKTSSVGAAIGIGVAAVIGAAVSKMITAPKARVNVSSNDILLMEAERGQNQVIGEV